MQTKNCGIKTDYKNCAFRCSVTHCNMMHGTHNVTLTHCNMMHGTHNVTLTHCNMMLGTHSFTLTHCNMIHGTRNVKLNSDVKISRKSAHLYLTDGRVNRRTKGRTDLAKVTATFRYFVKATDNRNRLVQVTWILDSLKFLRIRTGLCIWTGNRSLWIRTCGYL